MLSSIIAHHLQEWIGTRNQPVICLYLESKDRKIHTAQALLGSLLKQIIQLRRSDFVSAKLRQMYDEAAERRPSPKDIRECLVEEIASYERVYLVVDALDECSEKTRLWLLRELPLLQPDKLSIIITSRNFEPPNKEHVFCNHCGRRPLKIFYSCGTCLVDICQDCRDKGFSCNDPTHEPLSEPYSRVVVEVRTPDPELAEYVKDEMMKEIGGGDRRDVRLRLNPSTTSFGRRLVRNPSLLDDISRLVVENAQGNFILAKLYLDSLKDQRNEEDIRLQMGNFPKSVTSLYEKLMLKIKDQENPTEREIALKIFSILSCTRETLSFTDLQVLLALRPGDTDYHRGREVDREEIVDWTKALITIDGEADNEHVRLFHATFDSYLNDTGESWFGNSHADMARSCLTYMNFDALTKPFGRLSVFQHLKDKYPFVNYASQYWGDHVHEAASDKDIQQLAADYVSDPGRVTACMQAAWSSSKHGAWSMDFPRGAHGLHLCSWFGLSSVIAAMDETQLDVDVTEGNYQQTPLMFASRRGHLEVVKQLLFFGADVNKKDKRGRTAMVEAIEHAHEVVVDALLQEKALRINQDLGSKGAPDRTALMIAANLEHASIVTKLLSHPDIQINKQNTEGMTALIYAVRTMSLQTVESLLDNKDINVSLVDRNRGWSALTFAALQGQEEVVGLLLNYRNGFLLRDANTVGSALFRAIECRNVQVLEALLEHNAAPEYKEDGGKGALHVASARGDQIVLLVIANHVPDVNVLDDFDSTPLHEACRAGNLETVDALLELGADTKARDKFGRTPIDAAWVYRETPIIDFLVQKDFEFSAEYSKTLTEAQLPAWSLVKSGKAKELARAIETKRLDLTEAEPSTGDTSLHFAVRGEENAVSTDQAEILQMLLRTRAIAPDTANHVGRAPLHIAAHWGVAEAVEILIEHGASVDPKDKWDTTPLRIACSREHLRVVCSLLEAGADASVEGVDIQDLFFDVVMHGTVGAAERLLTQGADVMDKDRMGRTSVDIAKESDKPAMLQALRTSSTFFASEGDVLVPQSSSTTGKSSVDSPSTPTPTRHSMPFPIPADAE